MSNQLDDILDFIGKQARHDVIDALQGYFHNEGLTLSGSTEANDVEWFAYHLYVTDVMGHGAAWSHLEEERRVYYRHIASLALRCLPAIVERIADRYEAMKNALKLLSDAEWKRLREERAELRTRANEQAE